MRVVLAIALLAAGCGRLGFGDQPIEALSIDAPAEIVDTPDTAPDAAPVVVETLIVPSDGTGVVSTTVLELGVAYVLRASGTYTAVPPAADPRGDAEYYDLTNAAGAKDGGGTPTIDLGLAVDDPTVDDDKLPDWGPYNAASVYEVPYPGTGAPITAAIHDCCYGDNLGSLTLEILR